MPPLIFSPLIKFALGALGAGAIVHWVVKEVRRINEELDRVKQASSSIRPLARRCRPCAAIPAPAIGVRPDGRYRLFPTSDFWPVPRLRAAAARGRVPRSRGRRW